MFYKSILIVFFLSSSILFAQNKEVNILLQKVTQTKNIQEKKKLIEQLKEKLAKNNKKARQESDAIIKAKEKIPFEIYNDKSIYE